MKDRLGAGLPRRDLNRLNARVRYLASLEVMI